MLKANFGKFGLCTHLLNPCTVCIYSKVFLGMMLFYGWGGYSYNTYEVAVEHLKQTTSFNMVVTLDGYGYGCT